MKRIFTTVLSVALPIVLAVHENSCFCGQETGIAVSVHEIGPFHGQKHDCVAGKRVVRRTNMVKPATKLDLCLQPLVLLYAIDRD